MSSTEGAKTARRASVRPAEGRSAVKATKATSKKAAPPRAASAAKTAKGTSKAAPAKTAPAKTAAKKTAKTAATVTPAKTAPAKTAAKKTAKATSAKKTARTFEAKAAPAKGAPEPAKAAPEKVAAAESSSAATDVSVEATSLKVREDESPWTTAELADVRTELEHDIARLTAEISTAETGLHELLRDAGDGAGDDQADAGAKTFEREQEISLANNSREMLQQSQRALHAIDDATYGVCESCGLSVGKFRLQAFPRATLCVSCKTRQERR